MLFPTIEFVLFFFICFSLWLYPTKDINKKTILLSVFNIVFYSYHNPYLLLYLIAWTSLIYIVGKKQKLLYLAVGFGIIQLIFWRSVEAGYIAFNSFSTPLGISFFTFQGLTYIFAKMGLPKTKPEEHISNDENWCLIKLFAFIGFFPTVLSGPILRAKYWENQIKNPIELTNKTFSYAMTLICLGLFYKLCLSSYYDYYVKIAYSDPSNNTALNLWYGMYSYTFEIYHDFAGYSLMAMGIGLLFGFKIPDNFNSPYLSLSIKEFWQKWHMTFSSWLREYLYFGLGGNRGGNAKHIRNTFIVMLLCGAWHGLSSNYLMWGLLHAIAIVLYHLNKIKYKIPNFISWLITFNFISLSWIFFRSENVNSALIYIKSMFINNSTLEITGEHILLTMLFLISMFFHLIEFKILKERNYNNIIFNNALLSVLFWGVIIISILILAPSGTPPFIYFSF